MTTKDFDCLDMKRRGAEKIIQKIKDLTWEEQLAYWQQCTEKLRQRQQGLRGQTQVAAFMPFDSHTECSSGKTPKKFDCIKMKTQSANKILEKIKQMTRQEEMTYWQEGTEKLRQRQQALRTQNSGS